MPSSSPQAARFFCSRYSKVALVTFILSPRLKPLLSYYFQPIESLLMIFWLTILSSYVYFLSLKH